MVKLCKNYLLSITAFDYIKSKLNVKSMNHGTLDEWTDYETFLKTKHPNVYKLGEVLHWIENAICFIPRKSKDLYYYVTHTIYGTHNLKTGLKRGYWYDLDTKIIHGLFNELEMFIKEELGHGSIEAGLKHLEWEIAETSGLQAESAQIKKDLYHWWIDVYSKRTDVYDELDDVTAIIKEETRRYDEDTDKLTQLIKIRNTLWS